jgi:hypothetical protein
MFVNEYLKFVSLKNNCSLPFNANHTAPSCLLQHVKLLNITIYSPFIIPFAIMGILVGLYAYFYIKKITVLFEKKGKGFIIYPIMFLYFASMNISAIFADCFFPSYWFNNVHSDILPLILNLIDAVFSSMVNYCFILCGLVDINFLKENNFIYTLVISGNILIVCGYILFLNGIWCNGANFLYLRLCEIGSCIFIICSTITIYRAYKYLDYRKKINICLSILCAITSGLIGIKVLSMNEWFCEHSRWISNYVIWFLCSSSSLMFIFFYFVAAIPYRIINYNST